MSAVPVVERLIALREAAGLTQGEVAERMGTSQPVIARLEAGGRDPRLSTVERYARIVGAAVEVRRSTKEVAGTAARLAERIRNRLVGDGEPATTTFREVVQFLDDLHRLTDADLANAIQQEPLSTGDLRWDAVVAGAVDWAASSRAMRPPRWTASSRRRLPAPGWAVTPHTRLHALVKKATPGEFARHGVYVDSASLTSV